jgi:flagellar basal-body rod protein FlgG
MADLALWAAKSGIDVQNTNMQVISNNLANLNTTGFKRATLEVQTLPYQNVRQVGAQQDQTNQLPSGLMIGSGAKVVSTQETFDQGPTTQTNAPLDIAINGNGFFQILQENGQVAYTRDGHFQLNSTGGIVTANGEPLQPAITIPAGAKSITISQDGIVSVLTGTNTTPSQVGKIQLASFMNSSGLQASGANKYLQSQASGSPVIGTPGDTTGAGLLIQGSLEGSDVNMVEELVNMIQTQRAYEANSNGLQSVNQELQYVNQHLTS